ncbi:translation initiation factor 2B, delta subunit, putative [Entamoeba invadens IP1]|uniref:Translation initiation factor eIF2B subunit delta n=1 Tax=Entamoeba invadens IP1 TaxID=370355 RepID=A0A0A1U7U7_ENTIV|nr:translation initiation factor 2B, delta subunit, putative [Entamoeba invadens IP1]ELP89155.1 translation initiation factor 2B, delta subunit, putative [Entamoeba invadens IP1]|eukprot:XP_004255926.1 translation initiation factor 2B, delta subunit, putative [Entamoeba invadens IP1]
MSEAQHKNITEDAQLGQKDPSKKQPTQQKQQQKGQKTQKSQKSTPIMKKDDENKEVQKEEKVEGEHQLTNKELKALKKQQKHDKKAARVAAGIPPIPQPPSKKEKKEQQQGEKEKHDEKQNKTPQKKKSEKEVKPQSSQGSVCFDPIRLMVGDVKRMPVIPLNSNAVHFSFLQFALECSEYKCIGSTVRALRFIDCIIQMLQSTPFTQSIQCVPMVEDAMKLLENARSVTVGMNNVKNFIFMKNLEIGEALQTAQTISMSIIGSQKEIISKVVDTYKYINQHAVILTLNYSTLLLNIFKNQYAKGTDFKVIVVETSPLKEGAYFARALTDIGIDTTYILPGGLQIVLGTVTRVLSSASAMDGRGSVYTRAGSASVIYAAQKMHIPVIVCCETYKMTDGILKNEKEMCRMCKNATMYDEVPQEMITVVITEFGRVPPSSIPAIVREQRWDSKVLSQEKY